MISYFGGKSKLVNKYLPAKYGKIVEPFAGFAQYSLKHWENDVDLYDLSDYVIKVWEYLKQASPADILGLPDVPSKVHIDNYDLSDAEKYLIGFCLCRGKAKPRKTGHGQNSWAKDKIRIAGDLHKIRHWNIYQKSYEEVPNELATYFVDPPYKVTNENPKNGDRYPHWEIDYCQLAGWVKNRQGLVIACEGTQADYLPFELLTVNNANTNNHTVKKNYEYVYIQDR